MIGRTHTQLRSALWLLVHACMAALCLLLANAAGARTMGPSSDGKRPGTRALSAQSAASLYSIGSAARAAGQLTAARQVLTDTYQRLPSAEGLRELGLLALAENQTLMANDLLQRYLQESATDPAASEARAAIQKLISASLPPHGRLRIVGEPGSFVWLDEQLVGVLPLSAPLLVSPDAHKLRIEERSGPIESPIHVPTLRTAEVHLGPGDTKTLVVELLTAVVLVLEAGPVGGAATPREQTEFIERLQGTMENAHLTLVSSSAALTLTGAARLASCLSQETCQAELARLCPADYALHLRVLRPEDSLRSPLELKLVDAVVGEVAATSTLSCNDCQASQLASQISAAISTLIAQASARPRGQLEVHSSPQDAEVLLNGRLLGNTPYRGTHWVGSYLLAMQRTGRKHEERRLQILEGQTTSVHLKLTEEAAPTATPSRPPEQVSANLTVGSQMARRESRSRPLWRPILGTVMLGGAALFLGFGAGALAVHGSCATSLSSADELCPRFYDTASLGAGLAGAGGALALGGALLLALPPRR